MACGVVDDRRDGACGGSARALERLHALLPPLRRSYGGAPSVTQRAPHCTAAMPRVASPAGPFLTNDPALLCRLSCLWRSSSSRRCTSVSRDHGMERHGRGPSARARSGSASVPSRVGQPHRAVGDRIGAAIAVAIGAHLCAGGPTPALNAPLWITTLVAGRHRCQICLGRGRRDCRQIALLLAERERVY